MKGVAYTAILGSIMCILVAGCARGIDGAVTLALAHKETKKYVLECAWCGSTISTYTYRYERFPIINYYEQIPTIEAYDCTVYRTDPQGAVQVVWSKRDFAGQNEADFAARNAIAQDVKTIIPSGGYKRVDDAIFCSLKCVNAYAASKGIKEQRLRIILEE